MRKSIERAVLEGKEGLKQIVKNEQFLSLIRDYTLDEEAKTRIKRFCFRDSLPRFVIKQATINIEPASYLGRDILRYDSETVKWFLLLYCISEASDLLREKVLNYMNLNSSFCLTNEVDNNRNYLDLHYISLEKRYHLVDGIINLDGYLRQRFPNYAGEFEVHDYERDDYQRREWLDYRLGVSQFLLSAGYHYIHDLETVPEVLRAREVDMPFVLSSTMFISIITGQDFYVVLRDIMVKRRAEYRFDDMLAMIQKNIKLEELVSEKRQLESLLNENLENQRKQETAEEIIMASWGKGLLKDAIDERVIKCNNKKHRSLLYKCEALAGKRLSFLTPIDKTFTSQQIDGITKDLGVVIDPIELNRIVTMEDLIDTILLHTEFIECFKNATLSHNQLGPVDDSDAYTLETRTKEVEIKYGIEVDRTIVHSLKELQDYVIHNNPLLNKIVSMIANRLYVEPEEVRMGSSFVNDLGADSLDTMEMLMDAEREYGIRIPDEDTIGISTVSDLYFVVLEKIRGNEEIKHLLYKKGDE